MRSRDARCTTKEWPQSPLVLVYLAANCVFVFMWFYRPRNHGIRVNFSRRQLLYKGFRILLLQNNKNRQSRTETLVLKVKNDHLQLSSTTAVRNWIISYILHITLRFDRLTSKSCATNLLWSSGVCFCIDRNSFFCFNFRKMLRNIR